jgi:hypothetical protein
MWCLNYVVFEFVCECFLQHIADSSGVWRDTVAGVWRDTVTESMSD